MQNNMTDGNPTRAILRFIFPLFVGNVLQQLYNMADTIIVGRFVGANALAAVGSTGTILFLIIGFSSGLTTGFSVPTSQYFGTGDARGVRRSVAGGIWLSIGAAVLTTLPSLIFMRRLLTAMNTPDAIFEDAYSYIVIIVWGLAATYFYNLFASCLRAVGNSSVPLIMLAFSALLNVVLDLVLIISFHMGVAGAAIATVSSQGISAVLCGIYIVTRMPVLRPGRSDWRVSRREMGKQAWLGIPMGLQFAITAAGTIIMQGAINVFGAVAVAAFTAASKIQGLIHQGMIALGQGMATFSGQNYGKGSYDNLRRGVRSALIINGIYAVVSGLAIWLALPSAMGLFFSGDVRLSELYPWAATYVHLSVFFYPILGVIFIFRNTLQGMGRSLIPMLGGVVELVARLSMVIVSGFFHSFALVCFCDPFAWFTTGVYLWIAYGFILRRIYRHASDGSGISAS